MHILLLELILACLAFLSQSKLLQGKEDLLIGISSATRDFDRRVLIRQQQIEPYREAHQHVHWRFMLLNPNNDTLRELILNENSTYGDIIILDKYTDSKKNAIWIKPFEFFKYVEQNLTGYKYVAKMDDDTYMNITGLYESLFTKRIRNRNNTIVASWHKWNAENMQFPHGGFYALSWDLVLKLNERYAVEKLHFKSAYEDFQVGIYFKNASVIFNKVWINPFSCNYKQFDEPTPMSKCNVTHQYLNKFDKIIRVHLLKDEALYRNVSSYFVEHERTLRFKEKEGFLAVKEKLSAVDMMPETSEPIEDYTPGYMYTSSDDL